MLKLFGSWKGRAVLAFGAVLTVFLGFVGRASASADPVLSSAVSKGTSYFSSNIGVIIAAFVAVAALLWLLSMGFHSMGIRRKRSI